MTNIVVIGSCRHHPYNVTVPNPIPNAHNTEKGYQIAAKKFYPAIDQSDLVLGWFPEGKIGEHSKRDLEYAEKQGKFIILVFPDHTLAGNFPKQIQGT